MLNFQIRFSPPKWQHDAPMSVKFSIEMRTTALLSHAKFCPIGEGVRKGSREDITKSVKFLDF